MIIFLEYVEMTHVEHYERFLFISLINSTRLKNIICFNFVGRHYNNE